MILKRASEQKEMSFVKICIIFCVIHLILPTLGNVLKCSISSKVDFRMRIKNVTNLQCYLWIMWRGFFLIHKKNSKGFFIFKYFWVGLPGREKLIRDISCKKDDKKTTMSYLNKKKKTRRRQTWVHIGQIVLEIRARY